MRAPRFWSEYSPTCTCRVSKLKSFQSVIGAATSVEGMAFPGASGVEWAGVSVVAVGVVGKGISGGRLDGGRLDGGRHVNGRRVGGGHVNGRRRCCGDSGNEGRDAGDRLAQGVGGARQIKAGEPAAAEAEALAVVEGDPGFLEDASIRRIPEAEVTQVKPGEVAGLWPVIDHCRKMLPEQGVKQPVIVDNLVDGIVEPVATGEGRDVGVQSEDARATRHFLWQTV